MKKKNRLLLSFLWVFILIFSSLTCFQVTRAQVDVARIRGTVSGTGNMLIEYNGKTNLFDSDFEIEIPLGDSIHISIDNKNNALKKVVIQEDVYDSFSSSFEKDFVVQQDLMISATFFSDDVQDMLLNYQKGNLNEPGYKEFRKQVASEAGLLQYCDENYFMNEQFYREMDPYMLVFGDLLVLDVLQTPDGKARQQEIMQSWSTSSSQMISARSLMVTEAYTCSWTKNNYTWNEGLYRLSSGELTFCGQGMMAPVLIPQAIGSPNKVDNANLRKALYYGYQGPGDVLTSQVGQDGAICITNELASKAYAGVASSDANGGWASVMQAYWNMIMAKPDPIQYGYTVYACQNSLYGTNWQGNYSKRQDVVFGKITEQGKLKIVKKSSRPSLTNENPCYELEGAKYGLYVSKANAENDTNAIGTFTISSNGESNTISNLNLQKYYVKEIEAPKGYALDKTVYEANVNSTALVTLNVVDQPQLNPIEILVEKIDSLTLENIPSEGCSLEGALFRIDYYPVHRMSLEDVDSHSPTGYWYFRTDENGQIKPTIDNLEDGTEPYFNEQEEFCLPLGTVVIEEIEASPGYMRNPNRYLVYIDSDTNETSVHSYVTPIVRQDPLTMKIIKKQSGSEIVIPNTTFLHTRPDGSSSTYTTDKNGIAMLTGLIPGNHTLKEIHPAPGYKANEKVVEFYVDENNEITMLTSELEWASNTLTIENETQDMELQIVKVNEKGDLLSGAEFTFYEDAECTKPIQNITTQEGRILLLGLKNQETYYFKETKAPEGYKVDTIVHTLRASYYPATDKFSCMVDGTVYTHEDVDTSQKVFVSKDDGIFTLHLKIENKILPVLPKTGSALSVLLGASGVVFMSASMNRRKKK